MSKRAECTPAMMRMRDFFKWLKDEDLFFHLDDDPEDIFSPREGYEGLPKDKFNHIVKEHIFIWENFSSATIWDVYPEYCPIGDDDD